MIPFDKTILMKSGLGTWLNLLFFVLMIAACKYEAGEVRIVWSNDQAKGIIIPENDLKGIVSDSVHIRLLSNGNTTNILGNISTSNGFVFEPLVPFTRGLTYGVFAGNKKLTQFTIPLADEKDAPSVLAVYPLQDTLPENLLKMYIRFSNPMKEGMSADHVLLIKNKKDTLRDVFLDLQPELWNEDRTVLTLWLDPGRIKRDLQPNLKLGNPLQKNEKYELIISHNWQNTQGLHLQNTFSKSFFVSSRDSLSTRIDQWTIHYPESNTRQPLLIELNEPLDHFLLMGCLSIVDKNGVTVKGSFETKNKDKTCSFIPSDPWIKDSYHLDVLSKLEDLAGNNLNKVFDRDITQSKKPATKAKYSRAFIIQ